MINTNVLISRDFPDSHSVNINAANDSYRGRPYFEEAYQIEKEFPERSASLYESALAMGLDEKMRKAAAWRLFHLYRDLKDYGKALTILSRLGDSSESNRVFNKLKDDMADEWSINDNALEQYIKGVRLIHGGKDESGLSAYDYFLSALSLAYGNNKFRMEILNRLVQSGRIEDALTVLDRGGISSTEDRVMKADLLVSLNRYSDASAILRELALSNNENGYSQSIDEGQKYRILYLLGRIERDSGNIENAIRYFRYAARYANQDERYRQIALAAYSLFVNGYKVEAAALVRPIPDVPDKNVRLLRLILGSEVDGNQEKLKELLKMAGEIDPSSRSPLDRRALELSRQYSRGRYGQ